MKKTSLITVALLLSQCLLWADKIPDISVVDLKLALEQGKVAIIDVNGPKSFQKGHIPTAIEFSSSRNKLGSLLPTDKEILVVAYCGGPSCGAYLKGAKAAQELGYKNVRHLSAGISGWRKAGGKIEKP